MGRARHGRRAAARPCAWRRSGRAPRCGTTPSTRSGGCGMAPRRRRGGCPEVRGGAADGARGLRSETAGEGTAVPWGECRPGRTRARPTARAHALARRGRTPRRTGPTSPRAAALSIVARCTARTVPPSGCAGGFPRYLARWPPSAPQRSTSAPAPVAELVDARDLGSRAARRPGSSPGGGTREAACAMRTWPRARHGAHAMARTRRERRTGRTPDGVRPVRYLLHASRGRGSRATRRRAGSPRARQSAAPAWPPRAATPRRRSAARRAPPAARPPCAPCGAPGRARR